MGIWNTKYRNPALIAGLLAIGLAANPALAREGGSKRGGAGFASGALVGAAAGGPVGMVVGGIAGGIMGERSHQKQERNKRAGHADLFQMDGSINMDTVYDMTM